MKEVQHDSLVLLTPLGREAELKSIQPARRTLDLSRVLVVLERLIVAGIGCERRATGVKVVESCVRSAKKPRSLQTLVTYLQV